MRSTDSQEIIAAQSTIEKMRSQAEITARYTQKKEQYQELRRTSEGDMESREHLSMLYAEAKVLGWVLGKDEKKVFAELGA